MDRKQKEARRQKEDMALNRGLAWVGAAIVLECLLLLINRFYINFKLDEGGVALAETMGVVLRVVQWLGLAAFAAGLVWLLLRLKRNGTAVGLLPAVTTSLGAALFVCAHIALAFQGPGVRMLFLLVPAAAGLALVYYLYQREFFFSAAAGGLSVVGLWLVRSTPQRMLYAAVVILLLVVLGAAALMLEKGCGTLKLCGQEIRVMPKACRYVLIYATCVLGIVALAAGLFAGNVVAYYLMYAMVAWLFALLVYYTVKMM